MHPFSHVWTGVMVVAAAACSSPSESPTTTGDVLVDGQVVVQASLPAIMGDTFHIAGTPVAANDSLQLVVQYGGGCRRHEFVLHADGAFMESHPVQTRLALRHNANGDMCRAYLTRDLRFDLAPLRDAWRRAYQQQHGTIILRLRGYVDGIPYIF